MDFICFGGKVTVSTLNVGNGWEVVVLVNTEGFDRAVDVFQVLRERGFDEYDNVDGRVVKVFTKPVEVEEMVEAATNLSVEVVTAVKAKGKVMDAGATGESENINFV
jgi:DNA-binding protein